MEDVATTRKPNLRRLADPVDPVADHGHRLDVLLVGWSGASRREDRVEEARDDVQAVATEDVPVPPRPPLAPQGDLAGEPSVSVEDVERVV